MSQNYAFSLLMLLRGGRGAATSKLDRITSRLVSPSPHTGDPSSRRIGQGSTDGFKKMKSCQAKKGSMTEGGKKLAKF